MAGPCASAELDRATSGRTNAARLEFLHATSRWFNGRACFSRRWQSVETGVELDWQAPRRVFE